MNKFHLYRVRILCLLIFVILSLIVIGGIVISKYGLTVTQ